MFRSEKTVYRIFQKFLKVRQSDCIRTYLQDTTLLYILVCRTICSKTNQITDDMIQNNWILNYLEKCRFEFFCKSNLDSTLLDR